MAPQVLLLGLAPALAARAGFLILHQALEWPDALVIAIALVVVASMGAVWAAARRSGSRPIGPAAMAPVQAT